MKRYSLLASFAAIGGAVAFQGSYVNLQASTPGTAQTGHLNISGTARAGAFRGNGSQLTNLNASEIRTGVMTLTGSSSTYIIRASNDDGSPNASALIGLANSPTGITYGAWAETKSNEGRALFGYASATSGATYGSYAVNNSTGGRAAFGLAQATNGTNYGGWFQSNSPIGVGTFARNIAGGIGLRAESSGKALEVLGGATFSNYATFAGNVGIGTASPVWPLNIVSGQATLVRAEGTSTSGQTTTGYFSTKSDIGNGIYAVASASTGSASGIRAVSSSPNGYAIHATNTSPTGYALYGDGNGAISGNMTIGGTAISNDSRLKVTENGSNHGIAVDLSANASGGRGLNIIHQGLGLGVYSYAKNDIGVEGDTTSISAAGVVGGRSAPGEGIVGFSQHPTNGNGIGAVVGRNDARFGIGVRGFTTKDDGYGVLGQMGVNGSLGGAGVRGEISNLNGNGIGVYGFAVGAGQFAIFANGDHGGTGLKSFLIDDPEDPTNKMLRHYCTEGSQPLNAYSGNVVTDGQGLAWVTLPSYIDDINKDFRYQLTILDEGEDFVQVKVSKKINGGRFQVRTSKPGVEVSWRLEGVRNDLRVQKYGYSDVVDKPAGWKGKYLRPDLYNVEANRGIFYTAPAAGPLASDRVSPVTNNRANRGGK